MAFPTLNTNEIFSALYNMIISQQVKADNIKKGFGLVEKFRTDGTLYGDTKLFYDTEVLAGYNWLNDAEAGNLLALNRPIAPKTQAIVINRFRQIRLTIDNYLTKRAWMGAGSFESVTSVLLAWLGNTKEVFDNTLINAYVGCVTTLATNASISVTLPTSTGTGVTDEGTPVTTTYTNTEELNRLTAAAIGKALADLFVDMKDYGRGYTDNGFLKNFSEEELMVVWNADYLNAIKYVDLPTIFHKDSLEGKLTGNILPAKYFGNIVGSAVAHGSISANTYRAVTEGYYVTSLSSGATVYHLFAGDYIPAGAYQVVNENKIVLNSGKTAYVLNANLSSGEYVDGFAAGDAYTNDTTVICKVISKNSIPFMSAFETATEFWNPRSLTQNHYLTYGYSDPTYLKSEPIVKLVAA